MVYRISEPQGKSNSHMPNWDDVLREILSAPRKDSISAVRQKYICDLHENTGRNVIAYYSGFLQRDEGSFLGINDDDINALMNVIHGMDRSKGLDLILHTPGGSVAATEAIVEYLWSMFDRDIRAIIPQIAMSAGTMIACSCREIIMGKQSSLGPIDPQFSNIPAHGVIEEFQTAIEQISLNPDSLPIWQIILGKYPPTFVGECQKAVEMANEVVTDWLTGNMFLADKDASEKAKNIVEKLTDHAKMKTHSRHISTLKCIEIGLNILKLEADQSLQEIVLTTHHAYMHTFDQTNAVKIIENHLGKTMIRD